MHTLIYNLLELSIFAIVALAAFHAPEPALNRISQFCKQFDRISRSSRLSIIVAGLLALTASVALSCVFGIPEPEYHDEFSNLLAGKTFASGSVTNPSHSASTHFETFHVVHQPTYASKFPPAQGLILAAGQIIGGHSIVGVWLSISLACAALCWMLQAWMPTKWALFGTLLFLLQVRFYYNFPYSPGAVLGYWSQSYWGGAVTVFGSALAFGALGRIVRRVKMFDAFVLGLGLAILANSRPFEGLVISIATMIALISMIRRKCLWQPAYFRQIILPISIVLVLTGSAMGWYNYRVTGSVWQFPYLLHSKTYMAAPFFFFQDPLPPKKYNHELIGDFHTGWELAPYLLHQTGWGLVQQTLKKLLTVWEFYLGPTLTIPFLALIPIFWRDRRVRFASVICALSLFVYLTTNWTYPHHVAPIAPLVSLLSMQSIRQMRLWACKGKHIGLRLIASVPVTLAASLILFFWLRLQFSTEDFGQFRARIVAQLEEQSGQHVVFVKYIRQDRHYLRRHFEWVYNEPDIDNAKIVWAREMGQLKDQELLHYYKNRNSWLLIHEDSKPPILVPYPHAIQNSDAQIEQEKRAGCKKAPTENCVETAIERRS